jgi:two-component system, LytTR family, response regulator
MKKLNVAIIDDEKHAIETLAYDLNEYHANDVELTFTTTNPLEGVKLLITTKPDLLFLDVDMPGLSGLDLVELIDKEVTKVAFTTAHMEYAIKAVETIACGYLLKPVQTEDLQRIIERAIAEMESKDAELSLPGKIPVHDVDGIELVPCGEIIYIKSDSNYCTLKMTGKRKIVASKTLKHFEGLLTGHQFLRVHKSYLANPDHIRKYLKKEGGELLMSNDELIPVSRIHRDMILHFMQMNS